MYKYGSLPWLGCVNFSRNLGVANFVTVITSLNLFCTVLFLCVTKSSRNLPAARPNFRSVLSFAWPFHCENHHFAQPFLYVTISLRDQIFANHNFAILALREDKVVAKKWEFTVLELIKAKAETLSISFP